MHSSVHATENLVFLTIPQVIVMIVAAGGGSAIPVGVAP
jgi:hypothetical protein